MTWNRRHLLTIEELSLDEVRLIHATAAAFKRDLGRGGRKADALAGQTVVNLFLEPSTRARLSSRWPPSASGPT